MYPNKHDLRGVSCSVVDFGIEPKFQTSFNPDTDNQYLIVYTVASFLFLSFIIMEGNPVSTCLASCHICFLSPI